MASVGFVSLGCPKALVDSEKIITMLKTDGYDVVSSYSDADLVIVNTCGFIDSAIEESMQAIGEALKENGKVIVTGCLGAKGEVVQTKYPNVLGVTGPHNAAQVIKLVHEHLPKPHNPFVDLLPDYGVKLTPKHYAYLKIAEGCNNSCTFCIIPSMRGKLDSYPIQEVLQQAEKLVRGGCKELLVISQDTGAYGVDVKYQKANFAGEEIDTRIVDLCTKLGSFGAWVRLHYVYPYPHIDKLIPLMAKGLILPYLDVPLQHASPKILKAMKRPGNIENMLLRIKNWRAICPDITIRSTFIVGFPGETEEDFMMLLDFLSEAKLDRVGCFKYSAVEGAAANQLEMLVDEEVKNERYDRFMQLSQKISQEKLKAKIGLELDVIIDQVDRRQITARTKYDAPEIDGVVYIKNNGLNQIKVGDVVRCKIEKNDEYDLYARVI